MSIAKIEHIVVKKVNENNVHSVLEALAIEEPLVIILTWSSPTGKMSRQIAVTMRTPGNDDELAVDIYSTKGLSLILLLPFNPLSILGRTAIKLKLF
jgi:FdhD protein